MPVLPVQSNNAIGLCSLQIISRQAVLGLLIEPVQGSKGFTLLCLGNLNLPIQLHIIREVQPRAGQRMLQSVSQHVMSKANLFLSISLIAADIKVLRKVVHTWVRK